MVCVYLCWLLVMLLFSRCVEDLFVGWWWLIEVLGVVLWVLVWDGEGVIGCWCGGWLELIIEC